MYKYLQRHEASGEWIGTVRRAKLRGYVKKGATVKARYVGKYGVGVRCKNHLTTTHYMESIRIVQNPDHYFNATFERDRINQPPERRSVSVLDIVKKNDGYYCKIGYGVTGFFTNDWKLVECDVWEVLGV